MTRRSKRELERGVEELKTETSGDSYGPSIVYGNPDTGEWIDMDGRAVEPDTLSVMVIVPSDEEIMRRVESDNDTKE